MVARILQRCNQKPIIMRKESESKIQAECYRWFTNNFGLKNHKPRMTMFQVPNEVAMMIRGVLQQTRLSQKDVDQIIAIIMQRLKNTGLRPGVSDTIVVVPNKTLYIEFKTPTGYQSPVQKEFQNTIYNLGQNYYVVKSVEQFKKIIYDNID